MLGYVRDFVFSHVWYLLYLWFPVKTCSCLFNPGAPRLLFIRFFFFHIESCKSRFSSGMWMGGCGSQTSMNLYISAFFFRHEVLWLEFLEELFSWASFDWCVVPGWGLWVANFLVLDVWTGFSWFPIRFHFLLGRRCDVCFLSFSPDRTYAWES